MADESTDTHTFVGILGEGGGQEAHHESPRYQSHPAGEKKTVRQAAQEVEI